MDMDKIAEIAGLLKACGVSMGLALIMLETAKGCLEDQFLEYLKANPQRSPQKIWLAFMNMLPD